MATSRTLFQLFGICIAAAVALTGLMFPLAGGLLLLSDISSTAFAQDAKEITAGRAPSMSTVTDSHGKPIAYLFDQYRRNVKSEDIAPSMKKAVVAIEDRRFFKHRGVDWEGSLRAVFINLSRGKVAQGASTIDQQYVKNYTALVMAKTEQQHNAAIDITALRKIREIQISLELERKLSKDEILTRYLNLIPFGNHSFGIENAAQTYFGISAKELKLHQSALLAGLVQSTTRLNPYTNPQGALERRNVVLDAIEHYSDIPKEEISAARREPLGTLPQPKLMGQGCISAGNAGFFCDYVVRYLQKLGLSESDLKGNGYVIRTTLDPKIQNITTATLQAQVDPQAKGVSEVMSIISPGTTTHKVRAIASSRNYGLNDKRNETVRPQPFSLVGDGGGSVFKLFTVAAAMEKGMGTNAVLRVPPRYEAKGIGQGGARNCPPNTYCVVNAGKYKTQMSVTDALAQSPNTPFVELIKTVGIPDTVDMAIKLGLRSYREKGSYGADQSIENYFKENSLGSFTLGPTALNGLELSNVGATLASEGVWCPPSPIESITDHEGKPVPLKEDRCQRVVSKGLANTLLNALSKDNVGSGTSAAAARSFGWSSPIAAKTGTTETHRSAAFLGITDRASAATYVYDDSPNPSGLCSSPLRQCPNGNLFGGMEPARAWFEVMTSIPGYDDTSLPSPDPIYQEGTATPVPSVVGMTVEEATNVLEEAGYKASATTAKFTGAPRGTVTSQENGAAIAGATVTIGVSDGSAKKRRRIHIGIPNGPGIDIPIPEFRRPR